MLKIGKFDNLQEAINVAMENEQTDKNTNAVILHTARNSHPPSNSQARNRFQNFNPQSFNPNNRNNYSNGRYQQGSKQFRYQSRHPANNMNNRNFNQNSAQYQGFRNFGNNRNFGRYQNSARMYFATQQGNQPNLQLNPFANPLPQQGQPSIPNFSNVVSPNNSVNHNQQLSLPPPNNETPIIF